MIFLISLAAALVLVFCLKGVLRRHAGICYLAAALVSVAGILTIWLEIAVPSWISGYLLPVLIRGGLAGALFVLVMIANAFPNGSRPIKLLMPIRGQLSILASILTLGHNIAYGRTYFVALFTRAAEMPVNQLAAAICSLIMLVIMLPLFITSFRSVRKRMPPKKWKRLQRWAYLFYGLLYLHIMLLNFPRAWNGGRDAQLVVLLYTAVFGGYACCRICKAVVKQREKLGRRQCWLLVFWIALVLLGGVFLPKQEQVELSGGYADGVYTGSAMGMNAPITVEVTVEGGQITSVVVVSNQEDEPYFSDALAVIDAIVGCGDPDVDTVSGATYSSGGIIDAVKAALG